jgi:hypothetical protein
MGGAVAGCLIVQRFARNGGQDAPGREIESLVAQVILGGLITSVARNLLVHPTLTFRFGCFGAAPNNPKVTAWCAFSRGGFATAPGPSVA